MDIVEVGKKIRALRLKEDLTLEQLASALKIKKNMLSNYELGKSSISADLLSNIADYFNVSLDTLTLRQRNILNENTENNIQMCKIFSYLRTENIFDDINLQEILYTLPIPKAFLGKGDYFGLKVTDDSMNLATLYRGSIIVAKLQSVANDGDIVIYISKGSKAHYGVYSASEDIIIISPKSANSIYKPLLFKSSDTDFKIIGKAEIMFSTIITDNT